MTRSLRERTAIRWCGRNSDPDRLLPKDAGHFGVAE